MQSNLFSKLSAGKKFDNKKQQACLLMKTPNIELYSRGDRRRMYSSKKQKGG
jgi:hypothetical protein